MLDKQGVVQECWLSLHGMVCWISTVEYRVMLVKPPMYDVLDKHGGV